jgi:hypothetical protein
MTKSQKKMKAKPAKQPEKKQQKKKTKPQFIPMISRIQMLKGKYGHQCGAIVNIVGTSGQQPVDKYKTVFLSKDEGMVWKWLNTTEGSAPACSNGELPLRLPAGHTHFASEHDTEECHTPTYRRAHTTTPAYHMITSESDAQEVVSLFYDHIVAAKADLPARGFHPVFAVDCEGVHLSATGQLTLLQVASFNAGDFGGEVRVHIFDVLAMGSLESLRRFLEDVSVIKVMHDVHMDAAGVQAQAHNTQARPENHSSSAFCYYRTVIQSYFLQEMATNSVSRSVVSQTDRQTDVP